MFKSIGYGIGSASSERVIKESKNIGELLTDLYLDNWVGTGLVYATHNLARSRMQVCICEVDNFTGILRIKSHANENEIKKIFSFASRMVTMRNQLSVVFDDVLNVYIKECKKV